MYVAYRSAVFGWPAFPIGVKHEIGRTVAITEHTHDFAEVVVIIRGRGVQSSAAGQVDLSRGTVVMVRPGAWHGTTEVDHLEFYNLYLSPELFLDELSWVLNSPLLTMNLLRGEEVPGRIDDDALDRVAGWFDQIGRLQHRLHRPAQLGLAACILGELVDAASVETPTAESGEVLAIMSAMSDDVARPWSVADLAEVASLSPSQLHRQFSAQVGRSVIAWLDQLRGERAASLLATTGLAVSEIGRRVGWADPSYASRRFGRLYGMSPGEYRRRFALSSEDPPAPPAPVGGPLARRSR